MASSVLETYGKFQPPTWVLRRLIVDGSSISVPQRHKQGRSRTFALNCLACTSRQEIGSTSWRLFSATATPAGACQRGNSYNTNAQSDSTRKMSNARFLPEPRPPGPNADQWRPGRPRTTSRRQDIVSAAVTSCEARERHRVRAT